MAKTIKREPDPIKLRFGGGLHSRASDEDIDPRECIDGENFALDADNFQFRPRRPFDLVGTVPNAGTIKGAATLLKSDGTISTLIQSDGIVYEWTAGPTFTQVGTCQTNSKLRGRLEHQWQLSDKVIITDLALADTVKEWDGTTFKSVTFTDENDAAFGAFRAKYLYVSGERAVYCNITDNGTNFPHLMIGSTLSDYTQITVTNRPSGSLSAGDPFYLVQPDNFRINGVFENFGTVVVSSFLGNMYKLTGTDATDFQLQLLASLTKVAGDEALAKTPNDVVYGKQGKVESVVGTQNFGDVEANDLSLWIADQVEDYSDWLLAYNSRLDRTYCHPVGASRVYVFHHPVYDLFQRQLSPWSKWTTQHELAFNPTLMMPVLSPIDGLEYVLMGDASGNVYLMEGTTGGGDGGSASIDTYRLSGLLSAAAQGYIQEIQGWVRYRKKASITLSLKTRFAGDAQFDDTRTLSLDGPTYSPIYAQSKLAPNAGFYGTSYYYGTDDQRFSRERFKIPGQANDLQVQAEVDSTNDWTINEIGFRYKETN